MCLYFNDHSKLETELIKRNKSGLYVIRYKTLIKDIHWNIDNTFKNKYYTPYQCEEVTSNDLISDRVDSKLTEKELLDKKIHHGIHLYVNDMVGSMYTIYKVKCYIDDLVMISRCRSEEVYTKVEFLDLFPQETECTITKKEKKMEKMNWSKVLSVPNAQHYLTAFATGQASGSEIQSYLSTDKVGFCTNIRNFVRQRGVAEARRVARKALRRRGVNI